MATLRQTLDTEKNEVIKRLETKMEELERLSRRLQRDLSESQVQCSSFQAQCVRAEELRNLAVEKATQDLR